MKIQNMILNRMDVYRAQKYCGDEELIQLERRRRKSWTKGNEGRNYTVLEMRALISESDVRILKDLKPKYERYNSTRVSDRGKYSNDNSPMYPPTLQGLKKNIEHGKTLKTLFQKQ